MSSKIGSLFDVGGACQIGKSYSILMQHVHTKSTKPFFLININIWDPIPKLSLNDSCYFLLIIDDFIRFQWLYVMT